MRVCRGVEGVRSAAATVVERAEAEAVEAGAAARTPAAIHRLPEIQGLIPAVAAEAAEFPK